VLAASILTATPTAPAVASGTIASDLPALLTAQVDNTTSTYSREFFQHWIDADNDGCDTRREVLIAESTTSVTIGSGCAISGGTWLSLYDGATWTNSADVDIDHVVPLAEAWRSGAWSWTPAQRRDFANDLEVPFVLIGVTDNVNQSKGDKDPAEWMPPASSYHCQYVIDWALIKYRWSLTVDPAELTAITDVLSGDCGTQSVTLPSVAVDGPGSGGGAITFSPGINRLFGASRYDTAIQVSSRFPAGVQAAFVATGTNFPDALSGAAAAALLDSPLLLTTPTSLPASVEAELRRLAPATIYVLGGVGAVSAAVEARLSTIAQVRRLEGASRYATGLAVVNTVFTSSTDAVIATGRNFPDALAASGVAGLKSAPVVLVDGAASTVPTEVIDELTRLGVTTITIAGGTGVVSAGIESQLRGAGYDVTRFGGANRYETTAQINNAFFVGGPSATAFLATGTNFPDALAGAALAGQLGAPVYVTTPDCSPTVIADSRDALGATSTVVLGGTGVVSDRAAQNGECGAVAPPPSNPGDTKNCTDFTTWAAAQNWYLTYLPYYGDVARLDSDDDGIACESLPGAP
jgi:putative cell wall-binding protein